MTDEHWNAAWEAMPGFVIRGPFVDFWGGVPPTGLDAVDHQAGVSNFNVALQFAKDYALPNFPSLVLSSIGGRRELGAMERGYIDELARKAAVATIPLLDEAAMADPDMAAGYEYAKVFLEFHDAAMIREDIEAMLCGDHGSMFAGAVLHTYCRAAQLGALH